MRILTSPESETALISVCLCFDFSMVLNRELPGKVINSVYAPSILHTPPFSHSGERLLQVQGPPVPTRWNAQEKPPQALGRKVQIWIWVSGRMNKSGLRLRESSQESSKQYCTFYPVCHSSLCPSCQIPCWGHSVESQGLCLSGKRVPAQQGPGSESSVCLWLLKVISSQWLKSALEHHSLAVNMAV